jgi:hypothetical protein
MLQMLNADTSIYSILVKFLLLPTTIFLDDIKLIPEVAADLVSGEGVLNAYLQKQQ